MMRRIILTLCLSAAGASVCLADGNPTAPTPPAGDSSNRVATTNFVQTAIGSISSTLSGLTDVNVAEGPGINGYNLTWSNGTGKWIAVAPGTASISIGSAITGGTSGYGLYVGAGPVLGQFAYGSNVLTALQQALNGSGALAATTSPAFVTPNLGIPSAATLTNATGLPAATGIANGALPSGVTVN